MCLPKLKQKATPQFGDIVFFSNLKHCGIVNDQDTFFHAQCTKGTNLSTYRPFWKPRISGYRAMPPVPAERPPEE
jgi:cell wall-associated NlpC family hydrolase